uniref:Uncharacterized protein n=1 Tax=Ascaris lumbricoides TaxID=6252 RepID=A0A0M3IPJ2_ASCLU
MHEVLVNDRSHHCAKILTSSLNGTCYIIRGQLKQNVKRIFCMRSMIVSLNIGNAKYERKRENSSPFSPEPKSARRFFRIRELSTYDFSN